uniref:Amino acid transporter transmembrane domain-containing protein n=1 Tax=Ditylum brightwellii TaxID=49249 RepID=A0A7S4RX07_9STRA|mmetsp:Transcript_7394/g.10129  ORF Transcript_7394/g.10129 Transcript_7394/m.10129 type:complete len:536 (+) Transcript_7394:283-1890(+)
MDSNEIPNTNDNNGEEDHIPLVNRNSNETCDKRNNSTTGATSFQAALSIAKAVMGAGSFALPWSFKQAGYIAGPVLMFLFMILSVISLKLLVSCRYLAFELASLRRKAKEEINGGDHGDDEEDYDHASNKDGGSQRNKEEKIFFASSYVDVAREAFGDAGAFVTYVASVLSSVGVCGSYLVFIASNIASLLHQRTATGGGEEGITGNGLHAALVLTVLPFAIALSSVKNASHSAVSSLLGDVSVFLGMVVVIAYVALYGSGEGGEKEGDDDADLGSFSNHTPGEGCVGIGTIETIPLAFGSISFLFFIHFLMLPIESSMLKPTDFPKTVSVTMFTCYLISAIFGVSGYWFFGENTEQIVLLNVQGSKFVSCCKILLCIDLIFTYPVVMRPSIEIVERTLSTMALPAIFATIFSNDCITEGVGVGRVCSQEACRLSWWRRLTACVILGFIAACAGLLIPSFALFSGLVGGVCQTFLGFVFPPLMYLQLLHQIRYHGKKKKGSASWSDYVTLMGIVMIGILIVLWTIKSTWSELHTT